MSSSVSYLTTKAVCDRCHTNLLNECVVRPRENGSHGLRFSAISSGWLMCKCGFRFRAELHGVRIRGSD